MSVVEAQPMPVKADGYWSGFGHDECPDLVGIVGGKLHEFSSWSKSPCWQAGTDLAMLRPVAPPHRVWI